LRIGWIEDALAPLRGRRPEDALRQLGYGIGATLGIEAFVWLTDIAQLPPEEAGAIMRSIASRLLRSAPADGPPVRLTSKKHRATIVANGY
jgi:hypothetical protein